jgi:alpha-tubulin suppressor-like RCC1 family protein
MFNSPLGSLESIFVTEYDMIDQYAKTGSLWMWGDNIYGQLGDGTGTRRSIPVQTIVGGTNWKQVSVGTLSANAIKTDGTLWTWGWYSDMPNDPNSFVNKFSPVLSTFGDTFWKEVSGQAGIKTDGTLWLWGSNLSGELGNDNYSIAFPSPPIQTVTGGTDWKTISSGNGFKLAIKTDGTLWTWGEASYGQLGNNASVGKSSPVQTVAGGTNWKQVSGGYFHSAGIKTDGTLWTWGRNTLGELGDNTTVNKSSPVQTVAGGITWKQLASGYYRTAAIKTDGTLWNWGSNGIGELGDNTTTNRSSPVQTVAGGTNWKQVTGNSAAIKTDGTLWLWGTNTYGNIGDNTNVNKSSPVQTTVGGTNWKKVASNFNVSSAIHFYDAGNLYPTIPLPPPPTVEYLVVAGGGSGGYDFGGGGGAGGMLTNVGLAVTSGSPYSVTVGAGGPGNVTTNGIPGTSSDFNGINPAGGGGGRSFLTSANSNNNGGSGGGARGNGAASDFGTGIAGQGYDGGSSSSGAGGGGGAGAVGVNGGANAGAGGVGLQSSISGTATYYAGGGGGGGYVGYGVGGGAGGLGGGAAGDGGSGGIAASATVNTGGGGGGGAGSAGTGGNGGKGIVVISYPTSYGLAMSTTGSPTYISSGGKHIYKFTDSGSIKW